MEIVKTRHVIHSQWNLKIAATPKLGAKNQLACPKGYNKKTEEKRWLTEVSSIPLQQSLRDLETAYSNLSSPNLTDNSAFLLFT